MFVIPVDRAGLKEPTWENVVVGEEFGPLDIVISDQAVKSYVYAIDDYHPWYLNDSPLGSRIAPATLMTRSLLDLWYLGYDASRLRAVHVREELELLGPVKIGQRVTLCGRIADKFLKRGHPYVVMVAEASDDCGKTLMRTKQSEILRSDIGGMLGQPAATPNDHDVIGAIAAGAPIACFEWPARWWEGWIAFFPPPLKSGEAERHFGVDFTVEQLAGGLDWSQWPPGWAAYWLRRRP